MMLDVNKYGETLGELGFSSLMLRFLTDQERGQLAQIVTRQSGRSSARDVEHAGRLIYSACRRAEMRHPGFE
jgi:hypothetical protein